MLSHLVNEPELFRLISSEIFSAHGEIKRVWESGKLQQALRATRTRQ